MAYERRNAMKMPRWLRVTTIGKGTEVVFTEVRLGDGPLFALCAECAGRGTDGGEGECYVCSHNQYPGIVQVWPTKEQVDRGNDGSN